MARTLQVILLLSLCVGAGCERKQTRYRDPRESPYISEFAPWEGPLLGAAATEVARRQGTLEYYSDVERQSGTPNKNAPSKVLNFSTDAEISDVKEDSKRTYTIIKRGRSHTVTEYLVLGEVYKIEVNGGRWGFFDPIEKIKNEEIEKALYGSPRTFFSKNAKDEEIEKTRYESQRIIFTQDTGLPELLSSLRKDSYRSTNDSLDRPLWSEENMILMGVGSSGGHGCDEGLHLIFKTGEIVTLSGHTSHFRGFTLQDGRRTYGFYNDDLEKLLKRAKKQKNKK